MEFICTTSGKSENNNDNNNAKENNDNFGDTVSSNSNKFKC